MRLNLVSHRSYSYICIKIILRFMGSQRVGHDWATDLIWLLLICFQPFLRYSYLLTLYDKLSHLVSHSLRKVSLRVWYGTKPIYLGRKIYIFTIFSFVFQGEVVASFIQTCFYNSQICRFSFLYVPTSPGMHPLSFIFPAPHVVINDLTSSVVFSIILQTPSR